MNDVLSPWAKPIGYSYNKQHPLAQGLLAYWIFNEVKGTRVRNLVAPAKYIGTIASANITWKSARYGIGLNNTGATDDTGVAIASGPSFTSTSPWAIELLINSTTQALNDFQGLISDTTGNGQLFLDGGGTGTLDWWSGGDHVSASTVPAGKWTHIVVTIGASSTGGNFYINGVKDANTFSQLGWTLTNLLVANSGDAAFNGFCEYIRIWNRRLMQAEVQQLYVAPYAMHNVAPWVGNVVTSAATPFIPRQTYMMPYLAQ